VCCLENKVYDPMLGEPVPLEDYSGIAFGEELSMRVLVPENIVKEFRA
jgi:hypothetical protein